MRSTIKIVCVIGFAATIVAAGLNYGMFTTQTRVTNQINACKNKGLSAKVEVISILEWLQKVMINPVHVECGTFREVK